MKTPVAQAFTVAQVPFNRVAPHPPGNMNVAVGVVGFGHQKVRFDAVVSIDHTRVDRADASPAGDAVLAEGVFHRHDKEDISFFIRKEGNHFIGIIQERSGWRTLPRWDDICRFKVKAVNEMLQLAGQCGARSAVLDYPSTFDDRWLDHAALKDAVSSSLYLEWAKHNLHTRAAQIATMLEGVKHYARTIISGPVNKPLQEVIIALDAHAYAVWSDNSAHFTPHLQFDPPTAHLSFDTKRFELRST